jgi:hypothetical protein
MKHNQYRAEIMNMFMSEQFSKSPEDQKKQIVGAVIFRHVTGLVGEDFSPKITGMIIDLPMADLNYSVSSLETLQIKVRSAVQLLTDTGNADSRAVEKMPMNHQMAQG